MNKIVIFMSVFSLNAVIFAGKNHRPSNKARVVVVARDNSRVDESRARLLQKSGKPSDVAERHVARNDALSSNMQHAPQSAKVQKGMREKGYI